MPNAALGLMSAGIGSVPAEQTYLDASQGNRTYAQLYDSPLPSVRLRREAGGVAVSAATWRRIRERASSAPADLVPGALGSALARAGVAVRAAPHARAAALVGVNEGGRIAEASARCDSWRETHRIGGKRAKPAACRGLTVIRANVRDLQALTASLRGRDLLVAIAAPPASPNHFLPIAIAGHRFRGELTSDSTHVAGLVDSTDIAPTILERFGVSAPSAVAGQPITASGQADASGLGNLDARLAAIPGRRSAVIGTSFAAWAIGAALIAVGLGPRGPRLALPLLACTVAYLPAVLLVTAALEPGATAETLILALGAPALGLISVWLAGAWGGLAIAAAASVGSYAIDIIAGSHLTIRSLLGPDPEHGSRFYGMGDQLEAIVAPLVSIGVAAALTARRAAVAPCAAALAFAVAALASVVAFAPGRFGADVGLAIDVPVGAAVAVLVCLRERGRVRGLAVVLLVPLVALAGLALIDLATAGDAHLTRSVLNAGGLHDLGQVAERRLRLSADNFGGYADSPLLWLAAAGIVAALVGRGRVADWFAQRRYAWAGFLGAIAATAVAVLVNDSGGVMLVIGTVPISLTAAVAWATAR